MNARQLSAIARTLKRAIEGELRAISQTTSPDGISADEYNAAWSAARLATNQARYIAQYHATRADERAAFLRACGLDALAREAQMNLPRNLSL